MLEGQLRERFLICSGLIFALLNVFSPLLHLLVDIRGFEAVGLGPVRHGRGQVVGLLALGGGKLRFQRMNLLVLGTRLNRHALQHCLDLRWPQQENGAFGKQADGDICRESRQLSIRRLEDDQIADSADLEAQIVALGSFRRDEQQGLTGAIGGIAGIDYFFRGGNKAQRYAHALHRLGRVSVGVDDDYGQLALSRALPHGCGSGEKRQNSQVQDGMLHRSLSPGLPNVEGRFAVEFPE